MSRAIFRVTIPEIPPSNNRYIGKNQCWAYQEAKKYWLQLMTVYARPRPPKPLAKAVVRITYYFPTRTRHDPDNYAGKMLLDPLVTLGFLEDDSFGHVRLELAGRYDKTNPRTEIEIEEATDGPGTLQQQDRPLGDATSIF